MSSHTDRPLQNLRPETLIDFHDDGLPKKRSKKEFCSSNFKDFTSCTSLHGLQYLGETKRSRFERVWWTIMIVMSVATGSYLISRLWSKWSQTPVIVSFAESATPVWQIPFPAITICSETRIQQSFFNSSTAFYPVNENIKIDAESLNDTHDEILKMSSVAHICKSKFPLIPKYNYTDFSLDFLKEVTPNRDEYLECLWKRQEKNCFNEFVPITTNKGFCFSFNLLDSKELFEETAVQYDEYNITKRKISNGWNLETGYPSDSTLDAYPERGSSPSSGAGLHVMLYAISKNLDYLCSGTMQGFRVSVHPPSDVPKMSQQFFMLPLKQELIVTIKPHMIKTSEALAEYDPKRNTFHKICLRESLKRQCFMTKERKLKYFKIYTQQNCALECLSNYTMEICDCVAYWMPREKDMTVCTTDRLDCIKFANEDMEKLEIRYMMAQKSGNLKKSKKMENILSQCNCMPACTSISYDVEVSQTDFNMDNMFSMAGYNKSLTDSFSLTKMRIFFKESQFIPSKRSELYGVTDFLANCGGILGLFLGFSILSLVEILYFSTIRPLFNYMDEEASKKTKPTKKYVD
ncbi:pickpocket protein 28-like [Arctopsyche grandis]|uniref:pickpocket protein 28-like n=1 Tax=Arctopsyche grandis TaxID=121162 RepID=UPI00406D6AD0